MKNLYFLIFALSFFICSSLFSQSLKVASADELIEFSKMFSQPNESFGFSSDTDLPSDFSLVYWAPPVVDQQGSSCVGHAISTSLSITHNMLNDITEFGRCFLHRFDPYYVYSGLKQENNIECSIGCECGAYIWEGLELVINYGIKKQVINPGLKCRDVLTNKMLLNLTNKTSQYMIDDYYAMITYDDNGQKNIWDLEDIKEAIYYGHAPIVGIQVGEDFDDVTAKYQLPKKIHYGASELGGHAVTLIGWDDNRYGGSFLFQNSYGSDWGDNGYFWLTYRDFYKEADVAFAIYIEDYSDWEDDYNSGNYYKGGIYDDGVISEGYAYEGEWNAETGFFHGVGVEDTPFGVLSGSYKNGFRHGWWIVYYDAYDTDGNKIPDPFAGYVLFDQGDIIESESFGFTLGQTNSKNTFSERLRLDSYDLPTSDDPATIDDFNQLDINMFRKQLSGLEFAD